MKTPDMVSAAENKEIITSSHPEQKEGEIFFGNGTLEDLDSCGWHSKRQGEKAFDVNNKQMGFYNEEGDELDEAGNIILKYEDSYYDIDKLRVRPIFVKKSELEEAGFKISEQ